MPNWKKVIVSGSNATLNTLNLTSTPPTTTVNDILVLDGNGNIYKRSNLSLQGTQGTTGNTGNTGSQGTTGTQGTQGIIGTQGTTGTQGTDGTQGTTGTQGTDGTQGTTGQKGQKGELGPIGEKGVSVGNTKGHWTRSDDQGKLEHKDTDGTKTKEHKV